MAYGKILLFCLHLHLLIVYKAIYIMVLDNVDLELLEHKAQKFNILDILDRLYKLDMVRYSHVAFNCIFWSVTEVYFT